MPPPPMSTEVTLQALIAVEFALKVIRPENRAHALRLHFGFLTARGIDADTIAAHWDTVVDCWPER